MPYFAFPIRAYSKNTIMKKKSIIIILLLWVSTLSAQNNETSDIQKSIAELKAMPDDTTKINEINNFIWQNKFMGVNEEITKLGLYCKTLSEELDFPKGAGTALKNTAAMFYYGGDYETAIDYYQNALEFYKQAEYPKGVAASFQNLGNIYSQQGLYKQALDFYYKSLEKYEEIHYTKGVSGIYDAIGNVHKSNNDVGHLEKALEYYKKAYKVRKEAGDEPNLASSYLHIGDIFLTDSRQPGHIDSALVYFKKARTIVDKFQLMQYYGTVHDGLGNIFRMRNMPDSALYHLKESLHFKEQVQNTFGVIASEKYIGQYFWTFENPDSALYYYKKAIEKSKSIDAEQLTHDISLDLASLYHSKGDYKNASQYYEAYILMHDSLQNDEIRKQMTRVEMQYEFDKKEKIKEAERKAEKKRQGIITGAALAGFALMMLLAIVLFKSYRNKKKANLALEEKNNEIISKNAMLNQQKEEIEAQRDEIETQRDFVIRQRDKIAEQNQNIKDSIFYAQRIQEAMLPPKSFLEQLFSKHFVLFRPRDIVSGDYYWAVRRGQKIMITAADCTGHGVPGAFMSLLGISFLNEIASSLSDKDLKPDIILGELREKIKISLRQTGGENETKDGMDMGLCVIDMEKNTLEYAGANNPMLLVRNGELIKYKADRMPVGIYIKDDQPFTRHTVELQPGDQFYLLSDGYIDQFGGPNGRKFMIKNFKQLVLNNSHLEMPKQKEILNKTIEDWINYNINNPEAETFTQLDDIIVLGFSV